MAGRPLGRRVGKHGHLPVEERAGFHLQQVLKTALLQQKVEAAGTSGDFTPHNPHLFETGQAAPAQEVGHDVIAGQGMEHDGTALPFDGHNEPLKFAVSSGFLPDDIKLAVRQQQLP